MLTTFRAIYALHSRGERLRLVALFGGALATALVEVIGVASVLPFIALAADPTLIARHRVLSWAYHRFAFSSINSFLFALGFGILVALTASNALSAATVWAIQRFVWAKHHRICITLLRRYAEAPYSFFLDRNVAALSKTILSEAYAVANGVLVPAIQMLARSVVVLLLLALLLVVDIQLAAIVAIILCGAYGGIYAIVRRTQGVLGTRVIAANGRRFTIASEVLSGIKDLRVLGREETFLGYFSASSQEYSLANASNSVVSAVPRYALETVAFGGLLLILLLYLRAGRPLAGVLPTVTLYAVAGTRLLPALQLIFQALTSIRFHSPALHNLLRELKAAGFSGAPARAVAKGGAGLAAEAPRFEEALTLDDVAFSYPGSPEPSLAGVSLRIVKCTTVAFVGTTGSGKTTLVDLILGLHEPTRGVVRVDGAPIGAHNVRAWRKKIGYVPQHIFLVDASIRENIAFGIVQNEIDSEAVLRAARTAHLHEFVETLPDGYDTLVGDRGVRLSGGQRQRIGIARALYHDPELLVLDEATSALDNTTETAVMQAIGDLARKKTIILVAHRLSTVRRCEQIYVLASGRLVGVGTYDGLMASSPEFQRMAKPMVNDGVDPLRPVGAVAQGRI